MSYCRWSSNDFQCDLYVYHGCNGVFYINIAGYRTVYKSPLPERIAYSPENEKQFLERTKTMERLWEEADRVEIGLPFDGETFHEPDAESCANRVKQLISIGYRVPQGVVEALLEDAVL